MTSQHILKLDELDISIAETRIFAERAGKFFIGGVEIDTQTRELLRDQAQYLQTSHLWEILDATITNESAKLALIQSTDFDQVRSAKMLYHWNHVLKNMIHLLAK